MPGFASVRQARRCGRPSTTTRQSKQTPIPQKIPRGAPDFAVRRSVLMPAASNAAAIVSPGKAWIGRESSVKVKELAADDAPLHAVGNSIRCHGTLCQVS